MASPAVEDIAKALRNGDFATAKILIEASTTDQLSEDSKKCIDSHGNTLAHLVVTSSPATSAAETELEAAAAAAAASAAAAAAETADATTENDGGKATTTTTTPSQTNILLALARKGVNIGRKNSHGKSALDLIQQDAQAIKAGILKPLMEDENEVALALLVLSSGWDDFDLGDKEEASPNPLPATMMRIKVRRQGLFSH